MINLHKLGVFFMGCSPRCDAAECLHKHDKGVSLKKEIKF